VVGLSVGTVARNFFQRFYPFAAFETIRKLWWCMNREGEEDGMYGGNMEITAITEIYKVSVKIITNCYSWSSCG
jgi:hypothetical protein